uniref:SAM domain-containing protein n=1 Tax=Plectus sambesii TaxID=2011161 RepID=A0A914W5F3_9BILA
MEKQDTVMLREEDRDTPPITGFGGSSAEAKLTLALSDATFNQLLADAGPVVPHLTASDVNRGVGLLSRAPNSFFGQMTEEEASNSNDGVPHIFEIETEAVQINVPNLQTGTSMTLSDINAILVGCANNSQRCTPQETSEGRGFPTFSDPANIEGDYKGQFLSGSDGEAAARPVSACQPPVSVAAEYPSNTPYPGPYGFQIFFSKAPENESKKTISYVYVRDENRLYVRPNTACPIHFKVDQQLPVGTRVRAMPAYSRPQDVQDVVKRCMNHIQEDREKLDHCDHFIRSNHRDVRFEEAGPRRRQSVTVPLDAPPTGSDYTTAMFEFMCFSSCTGTINRRPLQVVFTLEQGDQVIGRHAIELKVCACPGRDATVNDAKADTDGKKRKAPKARGERVTEFSTVQPLTSTTEDDALYVVQIHGRELYKLVMTIIRNYEMSRRYEELSSSPSTSSSTVRTLPVPLGPDTTVERWLQSLDLAKYVKIFGNHGLHTLEDINGRITKEYLAKLGIRDATDVNKLVGAYVQFRNIEAQGKLSSLESNDSFSYTPTTSQQTDGGAQANHGYRVSKTTVRHSYKMPNAKRRREALE